ncbi:Hypothetical predicted protein [Pelobates cultripes]|nr:Hypothetical predicted protein [Pelobates cultripes]
MAAWLRTVEHGIQPDTVLTKLDFLWMRFWVMLTGRQTQILSAANSEERDKCLAFLQQCQAFLQQFHLEPTRSESQQGFVHNPPPSETPCPSSS